MKSRIPARVRSETIWIEKLEAAAYMGCPLGLQQRLEVGFTAFATVSDLHALRALTELLACGISVPEQASVTGFDDLIWSSAFRPALTTVHMDMPAIAEVAIDALTSAIEINAASDIPPRPGPVRALPDACENVPMTLVVRQTSAPPRLTAA